MKAIKHGKTKGGKRIVLAEDTKGDRMGRGKGTFGVWVESINHVRGKMVPSWGFVVKGETRESAEKVFKRRAA